MFGWLNKNSIWTPKKERKKRKNKPKPVEPRVVVLMQMTQGSLRAKETEK